MKITRQKGTKDIFLDEMNVWQYIEENIRNLCEEYNLNEIRTPVFESTELFLRGVGDETDIVKTPSITDKTIFITLFCCAWALLSSETGILNFPCKKPVTTANIGSIKYGSLAAKLGIHKNEMVFSWRPGNLKNNWKNNKSIGNCIKVGKHPDNGFIL